MNLKLASCHSRLESLYSLMREPADSLPGESKSYHDLRKLSRDVEPMLRGSRSDLQPVDPMFYGFAMRNFKAILVDSGMQGIFEGNKDCYDRSIRLLSQSLNPDNSYHALFEDMLAWLDRLIWLSYVVPSSDGSKFTSEVSSALAKSESLALNAVERAIEEYGTGVVTLIKNLVKPREKPSLYIFPGHILFNCLDYNRFSKLVSAGQDNKTINGSHGDHRTFLRHIYDTVRPDRRARRAGRIKPWMQWF